MFRDRAEAGRALADRLAPLTVIYARTLTATIAPELVFAALDEDGQMRFRCSMTTLDLLRLFRPRRDRAFSGARPDDRVGTS